MSKTLKKKEVKKEDENKSEVREYSSPEIEDLELEDGITPEMILCGRSGMGMCKHTYI